MRIIFAGTPDFACPALQALRASPHNLVAVYTQPDRPSGRGRKLQASPVKQAAQGLPICQPASLKDPQAQAELAAWQADVMVVVAYGLLLPKAVLEIPRWGCLNIHPSLLPRWRGAAPIQRAIEAGDSTTGVTIMALDTGLDTGPIFNQVTCAIDANITSHELHDQLAQLGAEQLLLALDQLPTQTPLPQAEQGICYAEKLTKQEAPLDWHQSAQTLHNKIRAYQPWPVATSQLNGQLLRLWQSQVLDQPAPKNLTPGTVWQESDEGADVITGQGILRLQRVQWPGKPAQSVAALRHGRPLLHQCFE